MLSPTARTTIRNAISLLLTGGVSFGSGMLLVMQDGSPPSLVQLWCAGITAAVLMGNDLKSRLTPTQAEGHR